MRLINSELLRHLIILCDFQKKPTAISKIHVFLQKRPFVTLQYCLFKKAVNGKKLGVHFQHVQKQKYRCFNIEWVWSKIFEFSNFGDVILEQVGRVKQQPSKIKHDGGIRPNVCPLTFGP